MKKVLSLVLAVLMLVAVFAGCSSKTPAPETKKDETPAADTAKDNAEAPADAETPADAEESHDPVTLKVWLYDDPGVDEVYEQWAGYVKEAYPWISMEFEVLPYDSGPEKFTVACATGTTPDIYFDCYSRIAAPVNAGLCIDVTDVLEANSDLFISEQRDGIVDGKYHYLATNSGAAYCMFVNTDMTDAAGITDMLPADRLTWSYDEFLAFLRAAKEANPDVYPMDLFAGSQSSDAWYYTWFLSNGVQLTNSDLTATSFNEGENREKALEVLDLFKTMIDEELVPAGCATMIDQDLQALYFGGKAMIAHGAFSNGPYFKKLQDEGSSLPFNFTAVAVPTKEGKEPGMSACFGSYGFCGFDNGGHTEAIKLALNVFLAHPELQDQVTTLTSRISLMKDTVVEYETEEIAQMMDIGVNYTAGYTDSSFGILQPWWTDFRGTFYPNLQDFFVGNIDAGTMLDNWQSQGDAIIAAAQAQ